MSASSNSSIRSRRVSAELRRYREDRGLTGLEVATALGMSQSKISRMETGARGLRADDVSALLGHYEVPERRREELLELVRKSEERGVWYSNASRLPELWQTLVDFERRATRIQNFETLVIPGLLQTPEYTAAIIQSINKTISDAELETLVSARVSRQTALNRKDFQFLAVIDELAMQRVTSDHGTMRRQLRRLVDEAERPNVTVRVVPMQAGPYTGSRGPFMTLDFADEPSAVFIENHHTGLFLEDEDDLAGYRVAMTDILASTLSPAESVDHIARRAEQL